MAFNLAQSFYVDKAQVKNSTEVSLTKVDLYFKAKPNAINNKSGIQYPGVEVTICPCYQGVPAVSERGVIRPNEPTEHGARFTPRLEVARVEWGEIIVSADGSAVTVFEFDNPIHVKTNQEYAVVVKYDGDEEFQLWTVRAGDAVPGTIQITQVAGSTVTTSNTTSTNTANTTTVTSNGYIFWDSKSIFSPSLSLNKYFSLDQSGTVTLFFNHMGSKNRVRIYQGNTLVASTDSSANTVTNLTDADKAWLSKSSLSDKLSYAINWLRDGMSNLPFVRFSNHIQYSGKISWTYNSAAGKQHTAVIDRSAGANYYKYLLVYPANTTSIITSDGTILSTTTTTTITSNSTIVSYTKVGPAGKYIGNLYEYISPVNYSAGLSTEGFGYGSGTMEAAYADDSAVIHTSDTQQFVDNVPDVKYLLQNWRPLSDTDLKFKVYVARFAHNGVPISSNSTLLNDPSIAKRISGIQPTVLSNNLIQVHAPSQTMEYIMHDKKHSTVDFIRYGETVYQDAPHWPGNKASANMTISVASGNNRVTANGSFVLANGDTFNAANGWNSVFSRTSDEYIIVKSGSNTAVCKVMEILSNTVITVEEDFTWTNTTAQFCIAPIGRVVARSEAYTFGAEEEMIILTGSVVNSTVRFVNNSISNLAISANGSGYANSDYVVISGYESVSGKVTGGYNATANIVTNGSGALTSVKLSNTGCGFVNTAWLTGANIVINNSSAQPSSGTGATFTINVGTNLKTEYNSNNLFANCRIINIPATRLKPEITVNNPLGTGFTIDHRTLFYNVEDSSVYGNTVTYARTPAGEGNTDMTVKIFKSHQFSANATPVLTSRSNEYIIRYANGTATSTSIIGNTYSNVASYLFDVSSNNDYSLCFFEPDIINSHYAKYVINNDYTNEHTNYGNAYAKHVTTKVNFADDRLAEDLLVYLTAYRPANTDIKVYARIHNSKDPEAFDDKDWTLMEEVDGVGVYSSKDDSTDFIELTYSFPATPNNTLLTGSANVENVTTMNVVGSGTTWDVDLVANDIVKIYQPLFPNNYVVRVVNNVINSTLFTIRSGVANDGIIGTGLSVAKITYKNQAFNNLLNDNIVRYHNEEMAEFDGYNTYQLKLVMISDTDAVVPKIDDVRSIGVST